MGSVLFDQSRQFLKGFEPLLEMALRRWTKKAFATQSFGPHATIHNGHAGICIAIICVE